MKLSTARSRSSRIARALTRATTLLAACVCATWTSAVPAQDASTDRTIRMPRQPQISPDGKTLAFAWRGEVWLSSVKGGDAVRLTSNPADDERPYFSPDGQQIAFVSRRSGGSQIHIVPVSGGMPRQVTFDSLGKTLYGFTPDGKALLVGYRSDRGFHYSESERLYTVAIDGETPKRMLLDVGIDEATMSPDGKQLLFVRGRSDWWRKGYVGPQAAQLWHADLTSTPPALRRLDQDREEFQNVAAFQPMWGQDGDSYFFVSDPDGTFEIFAGSLSKPSVTQLTDLATRHHSDDGANSPSVSRDGKHIVFRWRFDLCHLDVASGALTQLELRATGDQIADKLQRKNVTGADSIAYTADGKQMAFIAGEDVWVMDRILREPKRVTSTPHAETSVAFSKDDSRLFFVSDAGGEVDIWEATHAREDGIWWLVEDFALRQITDDRAVEADLRLSPKGDHIAYVKNSDLFVMDEDGTDHRRIVELWSEPEFDWSPDGKWFVYATQDADYNSDIWITSLDGTRAPFNLSRHPDSDRSPAWSGDGKRIAWVGRRAGDESDIYWVDLTRETAEDTERDRKLKKAMEAMADKGKDKSKGKARGGKAGDEPGDKPDAAKQTADAKTDEASADKDEKAAKKEDKDEPKLVRIDFESIRDRVRQISVPNSFETGLLWNPAGDKLMFSASIDGSRAIYSVEFPDVGRPKKFADNGLRSARWLADGKEVVGLSGSTPAAMNASGKIETFGFSARTKRDWPAVRQISFDQGWRAMRDRFYDPMLNNRDWDAIRAKYRPVAAVCLGAAEFSDLMNMMLGELNASHMGHRGGAEPLPDVEAANDWTPQTYHLGLRFELTGKGPGLVVESVIPGSPCDAARSKVHPGEKLLAIDGVKVGPDVDVDRILTLEQVRDLELTVADREGTERKVQVRPTTSIARLLYDEWVEDNRKQVEKLSDGRLGYLHIQGMNMPSFYRLEEDLYYAGAGKDGLIIDVRFNGGGSTTDHVLTALTQPLHALTKTRESGEGYPQDRKVYASWHKPIVLMCNEHSFSNAEILSHAIKQIGRGRLVGMRTAGGVISTGGVSLLDGSSVRMPGRGWYLATTGEDMELFGCLPDIAMWNPPGGPDLQLQKAVEVLGEDVEAERAKGQVRIRPAASRRRGN